MSRISVGQAEWETQRRVVNFFKDVLGYDYLGNWEYREGNSNIEEEYLTAFLERQGYSDEIIRKAIEKLKKSATHQHKSLYDKNREVYQLLRYGVDVKPGPFRANPFMSISLIGIIQKTITLQLPRK
ncbi:hypothetical protein FHEFKHOI_00181 [Candidatus Methanoperedenaceae archaeon GB50]|nr:hypothetical protein FHEFKHOI_00181 [Candidatus Methanoperedenaceae archaeon GB50]